MALYKFDFNFNLMPLKWPSVYWCAIKKPLTAVLQH